jgi:hypothetical protein
VRDILLSLIFNVVLIGAWVLIIKKFIFDKRYFVFFLLLSGLTTGCASTAREPEQATHILVMIPPVGVVQGSDIHLRQDAGCRMQGVQSFSPVETYTYCMQALGYTAKVSLKNQSQ